MPGSCGGFWTGVFTAVDLLTPLVRMVLGWESSRKFLWFAFEGWIFFSEGWLVDRGRWAGTRTGGGWAVGEDVMWVYGSVWESGMGDPRFISIIRILGSAMTDCMLYAPDILRCL